MAAAAEAAELEAAQALAAMESAFYVEAYVAQTYNLNVEADADGTVVELANAVERTFCRTFGFRSMPVALLQDRNHNDLPPHCRVSLCLRQGDRVFVHLRREAYACVSGLRSPVNGVHRLTVPPSPSKRLSHSLHQRYGWRVAASFRQMHDRSECTTEEAELVLGRVQQLIGGGLAEQLSGLTEAERRQLPAIGLAMVEQMQIGGGPPAPPPWASASSITPIAEASGGDDGGGDDGTDTAMTTPELKSQPQRRE